MGARETNRAIRASTLKPQNQQFVPIATEIFLPNHSGITANQGAVNELDARYIKRTGDTLLSSSTTYTDFSNVANNKKVRLVHGPFPGIEFTASNLIFDSDSFSRFYNDAQMNFGSSDDFQMWFDTTDNGTMHFESVPNAEGHIYWNLGGFECKFTNGDLEISQTDGLFYLDCTNADSQATSHGLRIWDTTENQSGSILGSFLYDYAAGGLVIEGAGKCKIRVNSTDSMQFTSSASYFYSPCEFSDIITAYDNVATVENGVPSIVASTLLTGQTAAKATTTIYAVPASGAGFYRVNWVAAITTAATTSSILGGSNGFRITYTNDVDSVSKTSNPSTDTWMTSAANTTSTTCSGSFMAWCDASTNLQYSYGYTSVGATPMAYMLKVVVESL